MTRNRILAAIGASVIVLALMSAKTTGALWRDSENLGAGTVSSGTLELLNGNATSQVKNYDFTQLSSTNLSPGKFVQAPLTMKNAGTADLRYRLESWTSNPVSFKSYLNLIVTSVTSASNCPIPGTDPQPGTAVNMSTPRPLDPGTTEVLCIRLKLDEAVPQNQAGLTNQRVTFTFRADQKLR